MLGGMLTVAVKVMTAVLAITAAINLYDMADPELG